MVDHFIYLFIPITITITITITTTLTITITIIINIIITLLLAVLHRFTFLCKKKEKNVYVNTEHSSKLLCGFSLLCNVLPRYIQLYSMATLELYR